MSIIKTNRTIPFITNEEIAEWDIHSANTSLMRYYNLCDESLINKIEKMDKDKRVVFIGKMMRKSKEFSIQLEDAFTNILKEFIKANNLEEEDIISYKKDAIFVRNKHITTNTFGDSVCFSPKNIYSGCILIPKYEFYYSYDKIDVKGISDSLLSLHENGVLAFINGLMEISHDWLQMNRFLKSYAENYKNRYLLFDAYREFNNDSKFRVNLGSEVLMDDIDEDLLSSTTILYNYLNIYLPVLSVTQK